MLRTRAFFALGIAVLVAACSTVGGGSGTSDSLTEQPVAPPGPGFLVYYASGDETETAWLEVDGEGYEVLAQKEGAYAAADDQLWTWTTREKEHEMSDCECVREQYNTRTFDERDLTQCQTTGTTEVPVLRRASGGEPLPLANVSDMEQTGEFSVDATNRGTVGPYWFGTVCTYIYACGAAHGSANCRSVVADLASGDTMEWSEFMGDEAYAETNERLRDRAIDSLEQSAPDNMQVTEPESAQLEAGWPVFTPDGMAFSYLFSASTCYACSDGSWSSYSLGVEVRDDAVPDAIKTLASPPAAVLAFLKAKEIEHESTVGWSALPDDGEARAAIWKIFRSADADATHGDDDD